jgi:tetratricopeptide (TPR) repeat protein
LISGGTMQAESDQLNRGMADLQQLIKQKKLLQARQLDDELLRRWPTAPPLLMLSARLYQILGDFDQMLDLALRAEAIDPKNLSITFLVLEYRIYCGQFEKVLKTLKKLQSRIGEDANAWRQISQLYTSCGKHQEAVETIERAYNIAEQDTNLLFNYGSSLIAVGRMDEAEQCLEKLIQLSPHDYPAYMNRASLRKQTEQSNHIEELRKILTQPFKHHGGEAQICYALGKEYEDLQRSEEAFSHYQRGAANRRNLLSYRVEADIQVMDRIIELFDDTLLSTTQADFSSLGPIFVMGLPRSGTTLVDRILASHANIESLGEINDFALALVRTARAGTDKHKILEAAPNMDLKLLGERYRESTKGRGCAAQFLVDKTPLNYLYLGLIHLSLPMARIIYVRRNAMDVCFAMYKTLFLMGYPFSYSFEDLAQYYAAFDRLMKHWHRVLPDRFLTVDYENLVAEQEQVSRQILDYSGLDWDANCLDFHTNQSASATASAAQVRQPIYRSSLDRWKLYETQLEPLRTQLLELGVSL